MTTYTAKLCTLFLHTQQPFLRKFQHPHQLRWLEKVFIPLISLPKDCQQHSSSTSYLNIKNLRVDTHPQRVLVYLHGGGFNLGNPHLHKAYASRLMQAGKFARVILPFYRLAPEYPYPTAANDIFKVWQQLLQDFPEAELYLGGESAGGNLAANLCLQLREQNYALPKKLFLHSAWLDLTMHGSSYADRQLNDAFLGKHTQRTRWVAQVFGQPYVGQHNLRNPMISPIYADLCGFPPCYLMVGEKEIFRSDSQTFAEKLRTQHIKTRFEVWPNMWHAFALTPFLPEAKQAIRQVGEWFEAE